MNNKSKGCNAERELLHLFWNFGWACIRVAGSGSSRYPSPDLVASNKSRVLAIECKTSKNPKKYLKEEDVGQIKKFSSIFSAEPWIGIRFSGGDWYFIMCEDLKTTGSGFLIDKEVIRTKGLLFEEVIKNKK